MLFEEIQYDCIHIKDMSVKNAPIEAPHLLHYLRMFQKIQVTVEQDTADDVILLRILLDPVVVDVAQHVVLLDLFVIRTRQCLQYGAYYAGTVLPLVTVYDHLTFTVRKCQQCLAEIRWRPIEVRIEIHDRSVPFIIDFHGIVLIAVGRPTRLYPGHGVPGREYVLYAFLLIQFRHDLGTLRMRPVWGYRTEDLVLLDAYGIQDTEIAEHLFRNGTVIMLRCTRDVMGYLGEQQVVTVLLHRNGIPYLAPGMIPYVGIESTEGHMIVRRVVRNGHVYAHGAYPGVSIDEGRIVRMAVGLDQDLVSDLAAQQQHILDATFQLYAAVLPYAPYGCSDGLLIFIGIMQNDQACRQNQSDDRQGK